MRPWAAPLVAFLLLPLLPGASAGGALPSEGTTGARGEAPGARAPAVAPTPSPSSPSVGALPPPVLADSTELHREVRRAQAAFERFRVQRLPTTWAPGGGRCDEWVGRFCLRFGPELDDEDAPPPWRPPPEPPEVEERRDELVGQLAEVASRHPGDGWVAGQRVAYLLEAGDPEAALEAALQCRATEAGWCRALEGLALYRLGRIEEADAAFEEALEGMDPDDREEWLDLDPVVDQETRRALSGMSEAEREAVEARIWVLADPLLLVPGNELRTEHLARHTLARTREDARNPHGIRWSSDMTRILVRFGPQIGYQRISERPAVYSGPPPLLGRFSGEARQLVPAAEALLEPAAASVEDFDTRRRRARARHEPVTSPRIGRMEVQLARFRVGDSVRVVGGWQVVALPERDEVGEEGTLRAGFFAFSGLEDPRQVPTPGEVGVMVVDPDPGEGAGGATERPGGWLDGRVGAGPRLLSLELLDEGSRDAWRHRAPLGLEPRPRGVVELSDLLLARPRDDAEAGPQSGDEAFESLARRALRGVQVAPGPVEVVWEVYGFEAGEASWRVSVTARPADRGRLRRLADRIGLTSAPDGLSLGWEEGEVLRRDPGTGEAVPLRRAAVLDLSALEPGVWDLEVAVELPGRTPALTSRRLELVERR